MGLVHRQAPCISSGSLWKHRVHGQKPARVRENRGQIVAHWEFQSAAAFLNVQGPNRVTSQKSAWGTLPSTSFKADCRYCPDGQRSLFYESTSILTPTCGILLSKG